MKASPCRVLIAAIPLVCLALRRILGAEDFEIVAETISSRNVLALVKELQPHLLILQADLERVKAAEVIVRCRALPQTPKILVMEGSRRFDPTREFKLASPDAYGSRKMNPEQILEEVRALCGA